MFNAISIISTKFEMEADMSLAFLILLRFVHVISSFCWAGGAVINYLFVEPTAKDLAPDGTKFVAHLVNKRRFNIFMAVNSTLTVASGALLLWQLTRGELSAYIQTGPGLGFAIGSMVGIAVYLVGMFGIKPRAEQLGKIGAQVQAAGGPPTFEQAVQLQKLDKEMSALSRIDFWLVALSLALMATSRYFLF
jgi:uncharacterized membrane protein